MKFDLPNDRAELEKVGSNLFAELKKLNIAENRVAKLFKSKFDQIKSMEKIGSNQTGLNKLRTVSIKIGEKAILINDKVYIAGLKGHAIGRQLAEIDGSSDNPEGIKSSSSVLEKYQTKYTRYNDYYRESIQHLQNGLAQTQPMTNSYTNHKTQGYNISEKENLNQGFKQKQSFTVS